MTSVRDSLCWGEYHCSNLGDVREASKKLVGLVADCYLVRTGLPELRYLVGYASSIAASSVVLAIGFLAGFLERMVPDLLARK
ncbi:hypothetical protein PQR33_31445 [Paraburkholderia sediminicola]|uniref:hypothetical protein n=1 Tax=Paraburkholderia sediminicola TaxID=458836 RepID=UPI0038BACF38